MSNWLKSLRHALFVADHRGLPWPKRLGMGLLRFVWILIERFVQDRCLQKTAALTYTSILSLFPLLAVLSIFATHFYSGGQDEAEQKVAFILERFLLPSGSPSGQITTPTLSLASGQTSAQGAEPAPAAPATASDATDEGGEELGAAQINAQITRIFHNFRKRAGAIAGIGALGLLVAAITLFNSAEKFFNEIWRVQAKRPFMRTFSAFATILVCLPALSVAATYASGFFDRQIETLESIQRVGPMVRILVSIGGALAPFFLLSLTLAVAYFLIPNTRVRFRFALAGGLVSGLLWVVARDSFFRFVGLSVVTSSVFGAFGATLVFLVWLFVLWAIILLGTEVGYLSQNLAYVMREDFGVRPCRLSDPRLLVLVLGRIAQSFLRNEGGIDFDTLQSQTALRESDLETLVEDLREGGFVSVLEDDKLTINRPLENILLKDVFALGCRGAVLAPESQAGDPLTGALTDMDEVFPREYGAKRLADLLQERPADS